MLIDLEDLKKQLDLFGVDYTGYTDEDLDLLLSNTIKELMGYTNLPLQPVSHKTLIKDYYGDFLELDYYPIGEITEFKIGSKTLSGDDYVLDDTLGILYLNTKLNGLLLIKYTCVLPDDAINNLVNPLIVDMIRYGVTTGYSKDGVSTKYKEGDVEVNFDTSTSLGNLIQSRITDLKNKYYNVRIRVV